MKWPGAASTAPAVDNTYSGGAVMAHAICSVVDCGNAHYARGFCENHYAVERRAGRLTNRVRPTAEERFWSKVDQAGPGGCWVWIPPVDARGYGGLVVDGRMVKAHRFSYELLVGPIPPGLHIDHLCRNKPCVNPDHLEPVTSGENFLRGIHPHAISHRTGLCQKGHPYAENAYYRNDGTVAYCKVCNRERRRAARAQDAEVIAMLAAKVGVDLGSLTVED